MRKLNENEMEIVAGGGRPGLVCNTSGDANHSQLICQTSSGLTIITTTNRIDVGGSIGISGKIKQFLGFETRAHWIETTTQRTVCRPDGHCDDSPPEVTKQKVGDASNGSSGRDFAFEQLGNEIANSDFFAGDGGFGGSYDGGGFGFCGGGNMFDQSHIA